MGNNQYPKTITAAIGILSNHRHDNYKVAYKKKGWSQPNKEDADNAAKNSNETKESNFAQVNKDKTCYCCGKKGHISPECKEKNTRKKEDWAFRQAEQHTQTQNHTTRNDDESIAENESVQSNRPSSVNWNY